MCVKASHFTGHSIVCRYVDMSRYVIGDTICRSRHPCFMHTEKKHRHAVRPAIGSPQAVALINSNSSTSDQTANVITFLCQCWAGNLTDCVELTMPPGSHCRGYYRGILLCISYRDDPSPNGLHWIILKIRHQRSSLIYNHRVTSLFDVKSMTYTETRAQ